MSEGDAPGPRRTVMRLAGRALSLVIVAVAIVVLVRAVGDGWRQVGAHLRAARPGYVALTILATLVYYLVWATRWRLLLRPVASVRWWPAQTSLMASVFVNTVVPFARSLGGLVRATYLGRRCGIDIAPIYGVTLLDQLGYSVASLACGAFFVPMVMWGRGRGGTRLALGLGVVTVLAVIVAIASRNRGGAVAAWVRRRMPGAGAAVESGVSAARRALSRGATWLLLPAGGAAQWLCCVLAFALAGRAVGASFSLAAAAASFTLGSMVGVASGTPGGIGTTESAAIIPLMAQGVPAPTALAAVLLARLIPYVSAVTIGGVCFLSGWRRGSTDALRQP
jgi:uncharacterized membrane protein YbhN (UPF0104 family)